MIFLLDTNVFSDLMREHPAIDAHLAALSSEDRIAICAVVRGEILYGLERSPLGKRRETLELKATKLFASMPCEPVPDAAADYYAKVKFARVQRGLSLDENDL